MLSGGNRTTKAYLAHYRFTNVSMTEVQVAGNSKGHRLGGRVQRAGKIGHDILPILPHDVAAYANLKGNQNDSPAEVNLEASVALCKKIRSVFRKRDSQGDLVQKLISLTFKELVCSPSGDDVEQLGVKMEGTILRDIRDACMTEGIDEDDIRVDFELMYPFTSLQSIDRVVSLEILQRYMTQMRGITNDFSARDMPINMFKRTAYCEGAIILPAMWKSLWLTPTSVSMHQCRSLFNIIISVKQRVAVNESASNDMAEITRKLYDEETLSDVLVISNDTIVANCHKSILAAQSQVFNQILTSNDAKKKKFKEIHLDVMTTAAAKAMIQFIYYRGVEEPLKCMKVAFQLLQAGERYMMAPLEEKMAEILINQPVNWYNYHQTVLLYYYCKSRQHLADVKARCVQIFELKRKGDLLCPTYKGLCSTK